MSKIIPIIMLAIPVIANAGVASGPREIESIGCHKIDNTCFVQIKGSAVGPAGCQSNSVRFNEANDANGKAALSLITAAFFAGKKVSFSISPECYLHQNNFPTFNYFSIVN